jgi:tetratricopeptide (TPR) repeat protein
VLLTTGAGYQFCGSPTQLDIVLFERHLTAAGEHHRSSGFAVAAAQVDEALALWRGEPFSGLAGSWVEVERARWRERQLAALELRAAILLDLGKHADALAELTRLVLEFPLREQFRELTMLALYRSGRQADAVGHYHQLRAQLAEELGVDPGPAVRQLYQRILVADRDLAVPGTNTVGAEQPTPRQLPPAPVGFIGRVGELAALTATLDAASSTPMAAIAAIAGTGGIGKTWLRHASSSASATTRPTSSSESPR